MNMHPSFWPMLNYLAWKFLSKELDLKTFTRRYIYGGDSFPEKEYLEFKKGVAGTEYLDKAEAISPAEILDLKEGFSLLTIKGFDDSYVGQFLFSNWASFREKTKKR